MGLPIKSEINPKGATTEERLENLVRQLQLQNRELRVIVDDLYSKVEALTKGGK